jgi:hypothetical protein
VERRRRNRAAVVGLGGKIVGGIIDGLASLAGRLASLVAAAVASIGSPDHQLHRQDRPQPGEIRERTSPG